MTDPFVHLRVASGYSLQYGASSPAALVEAAAASEMDTLALTDRGGLYGAIRFATACASAGIAPVVGADLAMAQLRPAARRRPTTPAKGGAVR
ncbi:MAG: PHP domain-containing protein, partial [Propionicimonas sp.]